MGLAEEAAAELQRLAEIKSETGDVDSEAKRRHKEQEQRLLTLMAREGQDAVRPTGINYTFTAMRDKVRGQIDDRRPYLLYMLEQEPSLVEFIEYLDLSSSTHEKHVLAALTDALLNLTFLKLSEKQEVMNRQAREHHDDQRPLPPGLGFRPVPYVSVVKHS